MKLVVDANILFACLLKKSATRKLWFDGKFELCSPQFIVTEFLKYKKELAKKFDDNEEEFNVVLEKALSYVKLVPDEELKPFLPAASVLSSDKKDWLYLACALKEDAIIWSNDKGFTGQKRVKVKNTTELINEFGTL